METIEATEGEDQLRASVQESAQQIEMQIKQQVGTLYYNLDRLHRISGGPFHHFVSSGDGVIVVEAKIVKPDVVYATPGAQAYQMPKPAPIKKHEVDWTGPENWRAWQDVSAKIAKRRQAPEKKKAKIARLVLACEKLTAELQRMKDRVERLEQWKEATREAMTGDDW